VQERETKLRWCRALEDTGINRVRSILDQSRGGERAAISIGGCEMTKGYALEWLAWYDQKKDEQKEHRDTVHRRWQRAGVILAFLVALATLTNWLWDKPWFNGWLK
jgi:hypothetical protein